MERDIIREWTESRKIKLSGDTESKMLLLAGMIDEANRKFNITGLKTVEEILTELIIKSIEPVSDIIVPRGTRFVDIGSGAGIPGIPLALYFREISGILIESNNKKAEFLLSVIKELKLSGLNVICERAEIMGKDPAYREKFDWCFARAFGKLFITLELGSPFVHEFGYLYVYSNIKPDSLPVKLLKHAEKLCLNIMSPGEYGDLKLSEEGLCFKKTGSLSQEYPRKYARIKRDSEKLKTD